MLQWKYCKIFYLQTYTPIIHLKHAMKRIFFFATLFVILSTSVTSQTVMVSGEYITGTVTLDPVGDVDGKPAYEGAGTLDGIPDVQVSIFWIPAPDNVWVLAFDGQPYFQNSCNTGMPPTTGNTACPWTPVAGQTCTGTDPLSIVGTGTLAVKLTAFNARKDNDDVLLNWITVTELNNKGFEIQRSADGINWEKIGFVAGVINSSIERNYQFIDARPVSGKNFYRIVQFDLDNTLTYSDIVVVKYSQAAFYSLLNNPGNGLFKINIEPVSEKIMLSVMDNAGRRIMNRSGSAPGLQIVDITNYPAGIYLLQIQKGTDLFTERLMKL